MTVVEAGTGSGVKYRPVTDVTAGKNYVILNASYDYAALYTNSHASGQNVYQNASKFTIQQDGTGYYIVVDETADANYVWYYNNGYMYHAPNGGSTTLGLYYISSTVSLNSSPDSFTKTTSSQSYTYGTGYKLQLYSSTNGYMYYSTSNGYTMTGGTGTANYYILYEQTSEQASGGSKITASFYQMNGLDLISGSNAILPAGGTRSYYLIVAPFTNATSGVNIRVASTTHFNDLPLGNVTSLARNTIAVVNFDFQ